MLAGLGNKCDIKPSTPRPLLYSRSGLTAKSWPEYVVTKQGHKLNGHQGDSGENSEHDTDNAVGNKHTRRGIRGNASPRAGPS